MYMQPPSKIGRRWSSTFWAYAAFSIALLIPVFSGLGELEVRFELIPTIVWLGTVAALAAGWPGARKALAIYGFLALLVIGVGAGRHRYDFDFLFLAIGVTMQTATLFIPFPKREP
jgi:hypothetical protein